VLAVGEGGAVDVGNAASTEFGKATGDLAAAEDKVEARRIGVLAPRRQGPRAASPARYFATTRTGIGVFGKGIGQIEP
jgi:hypothetical protein